jgi:tetratricopeptide (TPR) repeat protein
MLRVVIVSLVLTSGVAVAVAEPVDPLAEPTDAESIRHLRAGRAAYAVQKWDEAIAEFEAGLQAAPDLAVWLYNLGQAYRMAGDCPKAIWLYGRFIAAVEDRPKAAERVGLAKGFVAACQTSIDKATVAATRPPTSLAPAEEKPVVSPVTDQEPVDPTIDATLTSARRREPTRPRWYEDTLGWSLAGGAVVLGGVGLGLELSASSLRDTDAGSQREQAQLLDRADTRSVMGTLALVGAGAVAVAATVRLVLVPDLQLEAGPTHVAVRGRF